VKDNSEKIALFYLPSYSPDRNPDESLNCDLKHGLLDKPVSKTQEKLKKNYKTT
jgi:transposase